MTQAVATQWIDPAEAARRLDCTTQTVSTYAGKGLLTARRIGRGRAKYLATDVDRLAERSIRPATVEV